MMMLAGIDCCVRRSGDGDVTVKVVQHVAPARASSPEAGVQACQTRERRSSLEAQTPFPARRSSLQAKRQTVSLYVWCRLAHTFQPLPDLNSFIYLPLSLVTDLAIWDAR